MLLIIIGGLLSIYAIFLFEEQAKELQEKIDRHSSAIDYCDAIKDEIKFIRGLQIALFCVFLFFVFFGLHTAKYFM